MTYAPLMIAARRVLLEALEALEDQRDALVLVGAQAVYLYTGDADVAIATFTKDSDLALVPSRLAPAPTLEEALTTAGFTHDRRVQQPGEWSSPAEASPPIELLVPEALHRGGGRRGARIPPHSKYSARVVLGLEAAAVSHRPMTVASLEPTVDTRRIEVNVASPAALVVAKVYKIGERAASSPERLLDKDAHDLYRLLRAVAVDEIRIDLEVLVADDIAATVTSQALGWLRELSTSPAAPVPTMAGRTEKLVGDPADVAEATWGLIQDLLAAVRR